MKIYRSSKIIVEKVSQELTVDIMKELSKNK